MTEKAGPLRAQIGSDGARPDGVSVIVRAMSDGARVVLSGELDLATAGQVEEELEEVLERSPARLVIDLSGLEFMDAAGLRALLGVERRAAEAGRRIEVIAGEGEPRRLLELCGVFGRLVTSAGRGATNGR